MKSGFVALIGRPNAGKSTLLNALVGAKLAIVSDKPQTTRTRILGVKTTPHAQLVFVDTPGVHRPLHRLNVRMVDAASDAIRSVDVVALVVDVSEETGGGTSLSARAPRERYAARGPGAEQGRCRVEAVASAAHRLVPRAAGLCGHRAGLGADRRWRPASSSVCSGPSARTAIPLFPEDYLTDQPERRLAAEIVREQVLAETRDELPFTTAVVVDGFEEEAARGAAPTSVGEEPRGLIRVFCSILVERASQKPMLIGRGGADDQADWHRRAARAAAVLRNARVPRPAGEARPGLAGERARARRSRPRAARGPGAFPVERTSVERPRVERQAAGPALRHRLQYVGSWPADGRVYAPAHDRRADSPHLSAE